MAYQPKYITPDIKLSNYDERVSKSEVILDSHLLVWSISGETRIVQSDATHVFGAGDIFLIPRNQMANVILYPKDGLPLKSVAMALTTARLKEFYATLAVKPKAVSIPKIRVFGEHP